jgi:GNAT superfamily N-acetyltransferase
MTRKPPQTLSQPSSSLPTSQSKPPSTYPPPILLPIEKHDIPTLAQIHVSASSHDLLFRLYFSTPAYEYHNICAALEQQLTSTKFKWWFVKAVDRDDPSIIMGWGAWCVRPANLGEREKRASCFGFFGGGLVQGEGLDGEVGAEGGEGDVKDGGFPIIQGLPQYVHDHTQPILDDWLLGKPHLLLSALFTSPKYQRRGVGTSILKWGNERADEEGLPCFLQSTPFGYGLYKELGWKDVGSLDVDLRDWVRGARGVLATGWGIYSVSYMVRLPEDRREMERVALQRRLQVASEKEKKKMVWGVDFI